jgi:hypothetical protein
MGLLDDAIRQHLELKRLRGADPSEVILQERDALGPRPREEGRAPAECLKTSGDLLMARESAPSDGVRIHVDSNRSHLSQETVELDMQAVLEAESIECGGHHEPEARLPPLGAAAPSRAQIEPSLPGGSVADDFLEWEVPGEREPVDRQLLEEGFATVHRVLDARKSPSEEVLAGASDSVRDPSGQEGLWLDRRAARGRDFGR